MKIRMKIIIMKAKLIKFIISRLFWKNSRFICKILKRKMMKVACVFLIKKSFRERIVEKNKNRFFFFFF